MKKRKILFIITVIASVVIITVVYINNIFLPLQFKKIIIEKAAAYLDREVYIADIGYNPFKGIVVHDVAVFTKEPGRKQFLAVKEINFSLFIPHLLNKQMIIIPSVKLKDADVKINRNEFSEWNFDDIILKAKEKKDAGSKKMFILKNLVIENGKLFFSDNSTGELIADVFEQVNLKTSLSLKQAADFTLEAAIPSKNSQVRLEGRYHIPSKSMQTKISLSKFRLSRYLPLIYSTDKFHFLNGYIENSQLSLSIKGDAVNISGKLEAPKVHLRIGADEIVKGDLSSDHIVLKRKGGITTLTGGFNLIKGSYSVGDKNSVKGDLSAKDLKLTYKKGTWDIKSSFLINDTALVIDSVKKLKGAVTGSDCSLIYEDNKAVLSSTLQFKDAEVNLSKDINLSGNPVLTLNLDYTPNDNQPYNYNGNLTLESATLKGLPKVNVVTEVRGQLEFNPAVLETDSLQFVSSKTNYVLSGKLSNLKDPQADIKFSAERFNLSQLSIFIPQKLEKAKLKPSGTAVVVGMYKGSISDPSEADYKITARLTDADLELIKFGETLRNISGDLEYIPEILKWYDLKVPYKGAAYLLDGSLEHDKIKPVVKSTVKSNLLNFETELNLLRSAFQISQLTGTYYNSKFDIKGDVKLPDDQEPYHDLRADIELDLNDLSVIYPNKILDFKKINPQGQISLETLLKGKFGDRRNWQLVISGTSPKISAYNYKFENINFQYEQRDEHISQLNVSSKAYAGDLNFKSSADLVDLNIPFKADFSLINADLSKLKEDLPVKDKKLSGSLSSAVSVEGSAKNFREITGVGNITIADGHLWKFQLFKGLLKSLFIKEYEGVVFTDAASDFVIQNERIKTENLKLSGKSVELTAKGWIDFDKNIKFNITPRFLEAALLRSDSKLKGPSAILPQADNYLSIKLSGTLNKPNYSVNTVPAKVLKDATGMIKDGIGTIIEDIF